MRYIYGADGNVAGTVNTSGEVTLGLESGPIVGVVRADAEVYGDEAGAELLGKAGEDGRIADSHAQFVGSVDVSGRVLDATGRMVGRAERVVDGAVLLLLIARVNPAALEGPAIRPESETSIMDEVLELSEENSRPGVRKKYKPLTDEEVFGTPIKKPTP